MRLLVVEDDPDLNRQLVTALSDAGYAVDTATDGEEGHYLGETEPYDAVILDLGLPVMDGVSVLEEWRRDGRQDAGSDPHRARSLERQGGRASMPAPMITSRSHFIWRRCWHECARCSDAAPAMRRARSAAVRCSSTPRRHASPSTASAIKLTSLEFRLLAYLMHHKGRVVSRTELVEHLYDQDFDRDSNTIEVFVGRLRKKLGVDVLRTIRGLGYCITEPDDAA